MAKNIIVAMVVFAVVGIGIWYYDENINHTPIGEIMANPRNYDDKITTISGEVTDRTSLVIVKYFVLKDKTGEITVETERPLPVIGSKVRVRGKVKESFALGNEQVLVFVEGTDAK